MHFQWIPHHGPDRAATERIKLHGKKPIADPPIAWFMSEEQGYFPGLYEALTANINLRYIEEYLFDVGGGLKNFGRLEEWVEWFLFLLPYILDNILESNLLCLTINYFLNLFPGEITEDYPGFRDDVLLTLFYAVMADPIWDGNDLSINYRWYDEDEGYWTGPLYASLFLCLKYLRPDEFESWMLSIVAIEGNHWKSEIAQWLKGLKRFLHFVEHPEDLPESVEGVRYYEKDEIGYLLQATQIDWADAFLVFGWQPDSKSLRDLVPVDNIKRFVEKIEKYPGLHEA